MSRKKDDPEKMAQMARWLEAVSHELGVDQSLIKNHQNVLLDLIAAVAHGPSRPGAPLTAFLVGFATASTGADPSDLAAKVQKLAEEFT